MKNKPAVSVMAAILCLTLPVPAATAQDPVDKAAVCAGCHGPRGHSAVPDNPILAAQHADYLGQALKAYVSGERDYGIMKTMAERLSPDDTAAIIAYYAAQPPHQSQARIAGDAARGQSKTAVCSACHGTTGHSDNPMFPKLAGQHALYLSRALKAYRSGTRSSNPMVSLITEDLSDQDIEDIAAYYASQPAQRANTQAQENAR